MAIILRMAPNDPFCHVQSGLGSQGWNGVGVVLGIGWSGMGQGLG